MSELQTLETDVVWAEHQVVAEFQRIKAAFVAGETKVEAAVENIFAWITNHQAQLQQVVKTAITGATIAETLDPALAPFAVPAVGALDAAEAAIDSLATAKVAGSTPLSTLTNAYTAVKTAAAAAAPLLTVAVSATAATANSTITSTAPAAQ